MLRPFKILISLIFLPWILVECFIRPLSKGKSAQRTVLSGDKDVIPYYISTVEDENEESPESSLILPEALEISTDKSSADTTSQEINIELETGMLASDLETSFTAVSETIVDEIVVSRSV
jgi:hypothetical protein